ncbi:MAG: DUF1800 domain-containing protein, partial [Gemmatimonadales bacterium]
MRLITAALVAATLAAPESSEPGIPAPDHPARVSASAPSRGAAAPPLTPRDSAFHLLSRFAYGAGPGDLEAVSREGALTWLDRQTAARPGSDRALAERERRFPLLDRSVADLARDYQAMQSARLEVRRNQPAMADSNAPPRPTEAGRAFRAQLAQLPNLTLVRARYAESQVLEVMTDFWFNHFNVFAGKNLVQVYLPDYLEHAIRPNALGRFEDLLVATARHPAMLVYLDNALSVTPGARPPELERLEALRRRAATRRPGRRTPPASSRLDSAMARLEERMPSGLNENYARELLELHTLGVDGGYTQDDVVNVARILTGWSIDRRGRRGDGPGTFVFNEWAHDRKAKTVLGRPFPAGRGEDEGVALLRMLARHPATMHHVAAKLCARFVADAAPDGCIDDVVRAWRATDGDIGAMLRAIARSPDFWAPTAIAGKVKTPFEFVASAARALGAAPDTGRTLAGAVSRLGQPLFQQSVPTGYPETQEDWVNSGALLNRMNFAVVLAGGRLPGLAVDLDGILPASLAGPALIDAIDRDLLGGRMTANTRAVIARETAAVP